jgi:hypothetical protein
MSLAAVVILLGLPALTIGIVWLRIRSKERARDLYLRAVHDGLVAAGAEPLGDCLYRWNGRVAKVEASTNPLFGAGFSVRLAAFSDTIHEFELKRGKKAPPEFGKFAPFLNRWESAGKMHLECYAAGVTMERALAEEVRELLDLARIPLSKTYRGGTFTIREGFERDVPQWHWRHDQRPRLPKEVKRWCVSYWQEGPLLNPVLARLLYELAGASRKFFISDAEDLAFLEHGFGRSGIDRRGTLVELARPELPVAADLHTDGEFFGGLLVAREVPPGFEEQIPRFRFHDAAIKALGKCDFYARRLYDDEFSWFSGEVEIVSAHPLDVRTVLSGISGEIGAQVMDIDRRFHKRIVVPLNW